MEEPYEVEYWCERFGVSQEELAAAVKKVGLMASDVKRALQRGLKARDVTLTGDEIRMILDLVLRALAENKLGRDHLKVEPPAKRV
jgi:hypothetical protein